ncbi:three prime repair exonuclease 2-like isoform X2 [Engystomops pustulosus]|uniref:three prime repair exonuclease 2-like isoform X2 n=1 Tax=Engystomops pustulosus TaxID=76066 RepID=UPI003AFA2AAC
MQRAASRKCLPPACMLTGSSSPVTPAGGCDHTHLYGGPVLHFIILPTCPKPSAGKAGLSPDPNLFASMASVMNGEVKTFVFLAIETTGLEGYQSKITELCLVAIHVSSLENPVTDESGEVQLPRVMDKLCLCVDPGKPITEDACMMTGLSNENLNNSEKQIFNSHLINLIGEFVKRQAGPICLVGHNAFTYAFPLLKTELQQHDVHLSDATLLMDSLQAFRNLEDPTSRSVRGRHTLPEIYRRSFGREPNNFYSAEGHVLTLISVFIHQARQLLEKPNYRKWDQIRCMNDCYFSDPVWPRT